MSQRIPRTTEQLIEEHRSGRSITQIADRYRVTREAIYLRFSKAGYQYQANVAPRRAKPTTKINGMTYTQRCLLNALIQDERRSLRELMDLCNISSTSVAAYNLRRLAELGYISLGQPGVARSIRVIGGEQSACVGTPEAAAKVVARAKAWAHRDPVLAAAIRAYEAGGG